MKRLAITLLLLSSALAQMAPIPGPRPNIGSGVTSGTIWLSDAEIAALLRQHGAWAQTRLGELDVVLLETRDVLAACRQLAAQGVYCYDR